MTTQPRGEKGRAGSGGGPGPPRQTSALDARRARRPEEHAPFRSRRVRGGASFPADPGRSSLSGSRFPLARPARAVIPCPGRRPSPSVRAQGCWPLAPRPRGPRVAAAQTRVSPWLLRDRGRGRALGSQPSPNSCPRPAPEARSSGARPSVARPIDALGAATAEVRVRAAGRRGAGPCPCGPAGRCGGQGLGEAAGGAGGGRGAGSRSQARVALQPGLLECSCGRPGAPALPTREPRGSWSPGPASWAAAGVPESGPSSLLAPQERADAREWVAVGLSCPLAHLLTCDSVKLE